MDDLHRLPVIRFILQFDKKGGLNFGAASIPEDVAERLVHARLIDVWLYKPLSTAGGVVRRRYRKITAGARAPRFAALLREELRNRNLPSIADYGDGVGRVAFESDWRLRRSHMIAAIQAARLRLLMETT